MNIKKHLKSASNKTMDEKICLKSISLNHKDSCFYLKKSEICNSYGIFAKKDIPKNNVITYYYGYIKSNKNKFSNIEKKYSIVYDNNKEKTLIGLNDINKVNLKGVAQFVNDAISPNITSKKNNSCFIDYGKYVILKSIENIRKRRRNISFIRD